MAALGGMPIPDRLMMEVVGLTALQCHDLAVSAVAEARRGMPKMTGQGARSLVPLWGKGFFGMRWEGNYIWYQEVGIHPFTMKRLAGKIIPMWLPDLSGDLRRKNPKAKTKRSEDGRMFVLVFRRAAKIGARKTVLRNGERVSVPQSYPGAPGRISKREVAQPGTTAGKTPGAIARGNGGVRWRHPGLTPRSFLHHGMINAAVKAGVVPGVVYATTERWR